MLLFLITSLSLLAYWVVCRSHGCVLATVACTGPSACRSGWKETAPIRRTLPRRQVSRFPLHARHGVRYVSVHHSLDSAEKVWRALADDRNLFLSVDYMRALEKSPPAGMRFRYLVFEEEGVPVGLAYCQVVSLHPARDISLPNLRAHYGRQPLRNWLLRLVVPTLLDKEYKVLVCGNMLLTGAAGYQFKRSLSRKAAADLLSQGLQRIRRQLAAEGMAVAACLIKDSSGKGEPAPPFPSFGFRTLHFQPNMVLPLDKEWRSMADYARSLSSKYRVRYRKAMRKAEPLALRELSLGETVRWQPRLRELFLSVSQRQDFNLFSLGDAYWTSLLRDLGGRFRIFGYFSEDSLVGFFTTLLNGDTLEGHFLGVDKETNKEHQLYLHMLYEMIRIGIESGATRVHYARTAPEIKSTVGAVPQDLCNHLKISNPLLHAVFPTLLRLLMPEQPWVPRNPFRSEQPEEVSADPE